ncbi:MAG: hypothetical protein WCD16_14165 [Paracoccaceae bacterium]
MFIARMHIEARFGHKQKALELFRKWDKEIGPKAGIPAGSQTILSGSIGAKEAAFEMEMKIKNLAELDGIFAKLADIPEHAKWGQEMEPHVVSGSNYWQIFRVVE